MPIRISQLKDHSISVDQARYATSIVAKYLDTATVKVSKTFYKTTLPSEMIFTKEDVSTSDEQVESLTREYNIHYRACIGSLIYLLSTRVDLSFAVHKLAKFSANPGKVHFEGLVHLLRYMRDNKTLGLKYYADLNDAPVTDMGVVFFHSIIPSQMVCNKFTYDHRKREAETLPSFPYQLSVKFLS